ncbi:GNAT family N-acetyltransferase [Paucibacter sp. DJ1R-11]|uniref:GNAT family N-acetyltransferase n=1 Tax=Paucibacter sp. DJ1R-11 TaxID=2893556 RepID=UPI0021E36478|nr:GNAT family N-acetyltransferase [Paucibacter sp. DJ1R-11]MCV2362285.1 GNAT family N-acetyltransferase [Paucibacter sp. DJ1R-11]
MHTPTPEVSLQPVTCDNYEAICDLPLSDPQKDMLASNTWSLLEAAYNPGYQVRAIHANTELVGFMMWVPQSVHRVSIWRFMIALPHQGCGLGSLALQAAIREIAADPVVREVEICYHLDNEGSRRLYARHGFVEEGLDAEGQDMLAVLGVNGDR